MRYSATEEELLQSRASSHNSPTQGKLEAHIVLVENSLRQFCSITSRILTAHNLTHDYRAHIKKWDLLSELTSEVNRHFPANEHGDQTFFFSFLEMSDDFHSVK